MKTINQGRELSRQWMFKSKTAEESSKLMNVMNLPIDGSILEYKMTGVKKTTEGQVIEKPKNAKTILKETLKNKLNDKLASSSTKPAPAAPEPSAMPTDQAAQPAGGSEAAAESPGDAKAAAKSGPKAAQRKKTNTFEAYSKQEQKLWQAMVQPLDGDEKTPARPCTVADDELQAVSFVIKKLISTGVVAPPRRGWKKMRKQPVPIVDVQDLPKLHPGSSSSSGHAFLLNTLAGVATPQQDSGSTEDSKGSDKPSQPIPMDSISMDHVVQALEECSGLEETVCFVLSLICELEYQSSINLNDVPYLSWSSARPELQQLLMNAMQHVVLEAGAVISANPSDDKKNNKKRKAGEEGTDVQRWNPLELAQKLCTTFLSPGSSNADAADENDEDQQRHKRIQQFMNVEQDVISMRQKSSVSTSFVSVSTICKPPFKASYCPITIVRHPLDILRLLRQALHTIGSSNASGYARLSQEMCGSFTHLSSQAERQRVYTCGYSSNHRSCNGRYSTFSVLVIQQRCGRGVWFQRQFLLRYRRGGLVVSYKTPNDEPMHE